MAQPYVQLDYINPIYFVDDADLSAGTTGIVAFNPPPMVLDGGHPTGGYRFVVCDARFAKQITQDGRLPRTRQHETRVPRTVSITTRRVQE